MAKWTAVVLTCPNKNSSLAYQKELQLRQQKGFIDKESLVISIEDPEAPIGSGGATLNALYTVAEALSARKKHRMTQIEVIKDSYILICHMGRSYQFDIIGKAFATLPFQDENLSFLTNFDIIYQTMTNQIAGFSGISDKPHSDPGVYICSTDMLFCMPRCELIHIKETSICVISSKTDRQTAKLNGIYKLDKTSTNVINIHYVPDDSTLDDSSMSPDENSFNLINGIVYFNYEVAQNLYSLMLFSPLEACSYIGVDNGASPLYLSLFFDILLACCAEIDKEKYLSGSFKSNHPCKANQKSILKSARTTLWNSLHNKFTIKNVTVSRKCKSIYMNNQTFEHRRNIFNQFEEYLVIHESFLKPNKGPNNELTLNSSINSTNLKTADNKTIIINSIVKDSNLNCSFANLILNSRIESSDIELGHNSVINDVIWKDKRINVGHNLFIQNVSVDLKCLNNMEVSVNLVFGLNDNFGISLDPNNNVSFTLFNEKWEDFKANSGINESDLWPSDIEPKNRTLLNAKLYSMVHSGSSDERNYLSEFFWLEANEKKKNFVNKWRNSLRLSLEDIIAITNLDKLFAKRRSINSCVNTDFLVSHIVENKVTQFLPLIRNAVHDGYATEILTKLDEAALKSVHDLIVLPRIMAFISITLSEMALDFSTLRSGPNLNSSWLDSFQLIEREQTKHAILSLAKERKNWMSRSDLLIRASRHYEGAMLGFIRQATACFKNSSANYLNLKMIDQKVKNKFEWVEANSPARLDLAGAWSDTPPITYECKGGSCVTNVAILVNGKKPIGAKARIIKDKTKQSIKITMQYSSDSDKDATSFEFFDLNEFRDYNKPHAVACLMKAVFVFTKLIDINDQQNDLNSQLIEKLNGSLELLSWTGLPHGSGLGTSSILISCVLKVVWYLMGIEVSNETLSYSVLIVEQLMTTNGGWQDQVGGVYPGFKTTKTKNSLPLEIQVDVLNLSDEFVELINQRLVLIYTGITRLAKDLLLNVLRNWYAISKKIFDNVDDLVKNGQKCSEALLSCDLIELGNCINLHRKQKLIMAPGSEPESVQKLIQKIEPHIHGVAMAGAGGGGFLYVIIKDSDCKQKIKDIIETDKFNMELYDAEISKDGIEISFC